MASENFIAKLRDSINTPVLKFTYDGVDKTAYLQSVGEIRRDINLMPGYVQVTVDNIDGVWDVFLTNHQELTKKGVISFALCDYITYTGVDMSFHNNSPSADTIEDAISGFVGARFSSGMSLAIIGSDSNNQTVEIGSVTAGVITLIASDELTDEASGDIITLNATGLTEGTEELTLFTGYVIDADYDYDTKSMTLTLRDRLSLALEKKLQSVSAGVVYPVWTNYYDGSVVKQDPYILSDIVWIILTDYAKLDDTASTANSDIDYASWQEWATDVDNGGYTIYDIGIVSNGQACSDILMKIAQMTESAFWCGGEGKIKFQYGRTAGSWRTYTNEILKVDWNVSLGDRINKITCKWGYIPDYDFWISDTNNVQVDSETYGPNVPPYDIQEDIVENNVVFHNTVISAQTYMNAKLLRTAAPPRYFTIQTQLLGFCQDVRDDIALQNLYVDGGFNYDDIGIQINEITYIPETWETCIVGQYIWNAVELA